MLQNVEESNTAVEQRDDTDTQGRGDGEITCVFVYCDMICILLCTVLIPTYVSINTADAGFVSQSLLDMPLGCTACPRAATATSTTVGAGTMSQSLDMSLTRHQCSSVRCAACSQAATALETTAVTNASAEASAASGKYSMLDMHNHLLSIPITKSNIFVFAQYHIISK